MKWELIETRWAVMTRRIRADYASDRIEPTSRTPRRLPLDGRPANLVDAVSASARDPEIKTSAK